MAGTKKIVYWNLSEILAVKQNTHTHTQKAPLTIWYYLGKALVFFVEIILVGDSREKKNIFVL